MQENPGAFETPTPAGLTFRQPDRGEKKPFSSPEAHKEGSGIVYDAGFASSQGTRKVQQDAASYQPPSKEQQKKGKGAIWVVGDGLNKGGEIASQTAVKQISEAYMANPSSDQKKALLAAIQQANTAIRTKQRENPNFSEMATTVVAAVIKNRTLTVAYVGDSPAYLIRKGTIRKLTHDHTAAQEYKKAGILTEETAEKSPLRHKLTRSLGNNKVKAGIVEEKLEPGDAVVLCTDGVTKSIEERIICNIAGNPSLSAKEAAEQLMHMIENLVAAGNRSVDNTTIRIIKVKNQTNYINSPS